MLGTTLAHYRVTAKLGQGGMGEVYRATDTKLDRDVAIKILPEEFARQPERLARFEREAKALASLNHPNIAGIFGVEKEGELHALVMELVEGEDLSERLKRGPLPVEEALEVGRQIAEALEIAHEKGIIHRDLKPGNVKLTAEGQVKVLDFGLAKVGLAVPSEPGGGAEGDSQKTASPTVPDSQSPTITADFTMPGTLLGTAGYMSPEQARGRPVDKRSDIWSFGCVLWECLTGRRLFTGETTTDSIGALMHKEVDWSQLPPDTPPTIRLLLRKCLTRDRKRRLRDIGDAVVDLEQAIADPGSSLIQRPDQALNASQARPNSQWPLMIGIAIVACIAMAAVGWLFEPGPQGKPDSIRRIQMSLGHESPLELDTFRASTTVRISPDGSTLAFLALSADGTSNQLFLRRLDVLEAKPISAARNCSDFCFSPDGQWIAFRDRSDRQIKKVSVDGGNAFALCRAEEPLFGMAWSDADWIAFAQDHGVIRRVSAVGAGEVEALTTLRGLEYAHRWPYFLPGERALLFSAGQTGGPVVPLMIQPLPNGEPRPVGIDGHHPRYLSSGHLVFMQGDKMYGVGFDLHSLEVRGAPVLLVDRIDERWPDMTHMDVSADGTLAYVGKTEHPATELEWVERDGNRRPALAAGARYSHRLSPDGRFIACYSTEDRLMIYDLERGTPTSVNPTLLGYDFPLWTLSGQALLVAGRIGQPGEIGHLYWQHVDGQAARRLVQNQHFPISWRPDGRELLVYTEGDLRLLQTTGDDLAGWTAGEIADFQATTANEEYASFSPDGNWIAYTVEAREQIDLYVSRVDRPGRGTKVSTTPILRGMPVWTGSNEILYGMPVANGDPFTGQVMTVECTTDGDTFSAKRPVPWTNSTFFACFDFDPAGNRLLVAKLAEGREIPRHEHVVMFLNFDEYIRREVPLETKP